MSNNYNMIGTITDGTETASGIDEQRIAVETAEMLAWLYAPNTTAADDDGDIEPIPLATKTKTVTLTETVADLQKYYDNDLCLWITPGSSQPYWADRASWNDDSCIGGVADFLAQNGFDGLEGFDDDDTFTATFPI